MTQVLSAEDFLRDKLVTFKMTTTNHIGGRPDWETVSAWMVEFAKLHREAILEAVDKRLIDLEGNYEGSDSISEVYPIGLIK